MGQLDVLLWKNFVWCKRHYWATFFFYAVPLAFCGFLFLLIDGPVLNIPDCDFQWQTVSANNPAFYVSSLVCNTQPASCSSPTDMTPDNYFNIFKRASVPLSESKICPGQAYTTGQALIKGALRNTCNNRSASVTYPNIPTIDFVFRGLILYYSNTSDAAVLVNQMAQQLDQISYLGMGQKYAAAASTSSLAQGLTELATAVQCYTTLAQRAIAFNSRSDAVAYAQTQNVTFSAVWSVLEINSTGSTYVYKLIPQFNMRQSFAVLHLQNLVETAIIKLKTGTIPDLQMTQKYLPKRCHKDTSIYSSFTQIAFAVVSLGMICTLYYVAGEICYEKSTGLLEFLFIAGVSRFNVKLSWALFGGFFLVTAHIFVAIIFLICSPRIIEHTDQLLFFILFILQALALVSVCFVVSSLMASAQRASIFMMCFAIIGFLGPNWGSLVPQVGYSGATLWFARIFAALHPNVALQIGLSYVVEWENQEIGAQWSTLGVSPVSDDGFGAIAECMAWMIAQTIVYMFLSWYFDHTAPSKYGFKQPWHFLFLSSFWSNSGPKADEKVVIDNGKQQADIEQAWDSGAKIGIAIHNLCKTYANGKTAVSNISMNLFAGEVTILLGHNGAGKSTTMNMMTGMIEPSQGSIVIDGLDIRTQLSQLRQSMGFCPQYDIVYPELSVLDHMAFFGALKQIPKETISAYSESVFKQMKMSAPQQQRAASNLSGGMKRKLSIAISFLGNPKTVILDEPTSAIDPFSRRNIWDLILSYRANCSIVISTHYMQEADILGDRIAIINHGQLKAFGSTMYLKARYGSGFFVKMAHQKPIESRLIQESLYRIVDIKFCSQTQTETTFSIPLEAAQTDKMAELFLEIEQRSAEWGVASFGITESTLEQVFFNVAADNDNIKAEEESGAPAKIGYEKASGLGLLMMQANATLSKRMLLSRRSMAGFVFQILMPLIFATILLLLTKVLSQTLTNGSLIQQTPWNTTFSSIYTFFSSPPYDTVLTSILSNGLGTKCLNSTLQCNVQPNWPSASMGNVTEGTCDCHICSASAVGQLGPALVMPTGETMLNLLNRNVSSYLLKSNQIYFIGGFQMFSLSYIEMSLFNALSNSLTTTTPQSTNSTSVNGSLPSTTTNPQLTSYMNIFVRNTSQSVYMMWTGSSTSTGRFTTTFDKNMFTMKGSMLNAVNNAVYRALLPASASPLNYGIYYYTEEASLNNALSTSQLVSGLLLGLFSSFALVMPIFAVIMVVVNENTSGNKQLQFLMGLNAIVYWIANFIWDLLLYVVSIIIMIAFMLIFPDTFNQNMGIYFVLSFLFGISMILFSYLTSFHFNTARNSILLIGFLTFGLSLTALIMIFFKSRTWYQVVTDNLNFFPPYFVSDSLSTLTFNSFLPNPPAPFSSSVLGNKIIRCIIWIVVVFILVVISETGVFSSCCSSKEKTFSDLLALEENNNNTDSDVKREETRVASESSDSFALMVKRLGKYYQKSNKFAVKGVSFGVNKSECFGLLGVNGAGKTTLFKILSGFHSPSFGDASILGKSIFKNKREVAKHMSYCPQEDVLFENLTPLEHLSHYAKVRGIYARDREEIIGSLVDEVGLRVHCDKNSQDLSGGNKRKLNFAISILDYPTLIFLDEMTTGMDPKARRCAWNCLKKAINVGCATIITSHSMEECEQLCNRLVIMVNGVFQCIGGVQYLKDKYGKNYNVKLKLGVKVNDQELVKSFQLLYPLASIVERHIGYLEMQIPASDMLLSQLFAHIHKLKMEYDIEDFSVNQTSLEHVFVNMVKEQDWDGGN